VRPRNAIANGHRLLRAAPAQRLHTAERARERDQLVGATRLADARLARDHTQRSATRGRIAHVLLELGHHLYASDEGRSRACGSRRRTGEGRALASDDIGGETIAASGDGLDRVAAALLSEPAPDVAHAPGR
jgi:hypothetical protein